jgi:hypothetical protein
LRLLDWRPMPRNSLLGFASVELPNRGEDGKIAYTPILKWRDRTLQDGFSAAVVQAVEAQHGPLAL